MSENRNKENRECKNSVFVDLFYENESAAENDIALYNALHDEPLPLGTTVEKIRVGNELYMNFKNDVSFGLEANCWYWRNISQRLMKICPLEVFFT